MDKDSIHVSGRSWFDQVPADGLITIAINLLSQGIFGLFVQNVCQGETDCCTGWTRLETITIELLSSTCNVSSTIRAARIVFILIRNVTSIHRA